MHVEAVAQPLLGLATDFPLEAISVPLGDKVLSEVVAQVLKDDGALSDGDRLGESRRCDGDGRGLSQRVDGLELGVGEFAGLALVDLDLVVDVFGAFFEQPDDALRARLFKPNCGMKCE